MKIKVINKLNVIFLFIFGSIISYNFFLWVGQSPNIILSKYFDIGHILIWLFIASIFLKIEVKK
jgi:hypothetical protein